MTHRIELPRVKRVIIIHGHGGSSAIHWQTWLARKCRHLGLETDYPKLPDKNNPQLPAWLEALKRLPKPDSTTAIVSHSLACWTVLRFIEQIEAEIGLAILVAPVEASKVISRLPELKGFFEGFSPESLVELSKRMKTVRVIASDNDPWTHGKTNAKLLAEYLNAEFMLMPGQGHMNVASGHATLPQVLELVKQHI